MIHKLRFEGRGSVRLKMGEVFQVEGIDYAKSQREKAWCARKLRVNNVEF